MRTILFVLALLGAVVGRGQIVLDWYPSAAPVVVNPLLDDVPNARCAFSLRLLRAGYTGNCIRVRRSSDNQLQNIGFTGGYLDTLSLKNFCGVSNCFVETWYDQSLFGSHATQSNDVTRQPRIIEAGVIERSGGLPAVRFLGGFQELNINELPVPTSSLTFLVGQKTLTTGSLIGIASNFTDRCRLTKSPSNTIIYRSLATERVETSNTYNALDREYIMGSTVSGVQSVFRNSLIQSTATTLASTAASVARLGRDGSLNGSTAYLQEAILWNSDQSSNISTININVNSFYNIY